MQVQTVSGDRVEQFNSLHVGMRSIKVRHGILWLNGRRLWLHGAAIHEDVDGRGAALSGGDIDTIVSQLRSVGANITRAHYLLSDQLLDALDAAGIMVWSQPPVDHADSKLATAGGRRRALGMLRATILGERSHPSVVVDSVANELTPTPNTMPGTEKYLSQAIDLAHRLDPAAVVGLDTYCYPGFARQRIYSRLDVLGIDDYFGWYTGKAGHSVADFNELGPFLRQSHARYPRQALVVSEFGAEALYDGPAPLESRATRSRSDLVAVVREPSHATGRLGGGPFALSEEGYLRLIGAQLRALALPDRPVNVTQNLYLPFVRSFGARMPIRTRVPTRR